MALVTSMRLSVQPVTDAEWALVMEMAGLRTEPALPAVPPKVSATKVERLLLAAVRRRDHNALRHPARAPAACLR